MWWNGWNVIQRNIVKDLRNCCTILPCFLAESQRGICRERATDNKNSKNHITRKIQNIVKSESGRSTARKPFATWNWQLALHCCCLFYFWVSLSLYLSLWVDNQEKCIISCLPANVTDVHNSDNVCGWGRIANRGFCLTW